MTILGIGGILGDAASAIVKDGQLVAAVEEVKVSRQYRVGALPEASIAACLSMAAAKPDATATALPELEPQGLRARSRLKSRLPFVKIGVSGELTYLATLSMPM